MEFIDDDENTGSNPYEMQQRQRNSNYRKGGGSYGYEQDERTDRSGGRSGPQSSNRRRGGGEDHVNANGRPKTGHKKSHVDTSYYLDDPNDNDYRNYYNNDLDDDDQNYDYM